MATVQIPRIEAQTRDVLGTRPAIRIRKAGRLPAVIYGHKQDPMHVSLDYDQFSELAHRNVHILEVAVAGKTEPCLIKDMQWDYLGTTLAHVDLARVDLTEKVRLEVEIELVGEPVGAKAAGAFLQKFHNEIEIECLASQIPESIKIDVTKLEAGEHLSVRDIPLPEGVKAITDPDVAIVGILIAKEEEAAAPVEGATAEPEVIGRKVEEGEEAPAAAGDKKAAEKKPAEKKGEKK